MTEDLPRTRMMTDDELADIEDRLDLFLHGDRAAFEAIVHADTPFPIWYLDITDLLGDARLAREEIAALIADNHILRTKLAAGA